MGNNKLKIQNTVNIKNRKARHEFELMDSYVAGMVLSGTEIKSIRQSKVQLQSAYCYFEKGELWVIGMHISEYEEGTCYNHEPTRKRKLLLQKKELKKLEKKSDEKGLTIVVTNLFINKKGFAKLGIALAKGKKLYDKREDIKSKDTQRDLDRRQL